MSRDLIWLEDPDCTQSTLTGSKVANLSRLAHITLQKSFVPSAQREMWYETFLGNYSYTVPSGFCLTTSAFATYGYNNVEQSDSVTAMQSLPESVQAMLQDAYQTLATRNRSNAPAVAVRSSAIGEDGQDASFAGQYETYLNIVGVDALQEAVAACWASAHSERVKAYRKQQGQDTEPVQLAVFVQQLVAADVALVAFSNHPVSGNSDEIVINATWGLGESLVGGTVTPDSYTVQKSDLQITEQAIAAKQVMTIAAPHGVREVPVPRPMQQLPTLNTSQVQEVATLAQTLENEMGWPVDIECAYQDETLYLLQCRPITV